MLGSGGCRIIAGHRVGRHVIGHSPSGIWCGALWPLLFLGLLTVSDALSAGSEKSLDGLAEPRDGVFVGGLIHLKPQ